MRHRPAFTLRTHRRALLGAALWLMPWVVASPAVGQAGGAGTVFGIVTDTTGTPLAGATVALLQPSDSVMVGFASARADGAFRVERVPPGAYVLRVSFIGYAAAHIAVDLAREVDVGLVVLQPRVGEIGELVVSQSRVPVVVREDTLDYDAAAFDVREGATVEDLLRRMPGVEVEADGTVRAQGEVVRRVLVDGKEFFGDSPTLATRNLPAEAVDRVQVFDKASDLAEFTGVDDGTGTRTINLTLKEDHRVGSFGKIDGGAGADAATDGAMRYTGGGSLNRFSPTTRLSGIASTNNVNRAGLSVEEYVRLLGGPAALASGDQGVVRIDAAVPVGDGASDGYATTSMGGANASVDVGERLSLQASYLGYGVVTDRDRRSLREELAEGEVAVRETEVVEDDGSQAMHRLTLLAEHEVGDGHDVRLRSTLRAGGAEGASLNQRARGDAAAGDAASVVAQYEGTSHDLGGEASVTYRRRLGEGRTLVAEAGASAGRADRDASLTTTASGGGASTRTAAERRSQSVSLGEGWLSLRALRSFGSGRSLQLRAEHRAAGETVDRDGLGLSVPSFDRTSASSRGGVQYNDRWGDLRLGIGLDLEWAQLAAGDVRARTTEWSSVRLLPSATLRYQVTPNRTLQIGYATSVREPTAVELQPVVDVRDPFAVTIGNPALRPETSRTLTARYVHFDPFSLLTAFAFARASYTTEAISASQTVDDAFRRTVMPVNVEDGWSVLGSGSVSGPVGALASTVGVTATMLSTWRRELFDGVPNETRLWQSTADVWLQTQTVDVMDLRVGVRAALRSTSYSLASTLDRTYLVGTPYAAAIWTTAGGWALGTTLEHDLRTASGFGVTRQVPLWGVSVSRSLRGGQARLALSVEDALDRNLRVDYLATATSVEQTTVSTLGRYALLTFRYDL